MLHDFPHARVLVIDDEPSNLELLRRVLTRHGLVHVSLAGDPRTAVASLETVDPDLVLLDLHMPHLAGHEVLAMIRQWARGAFLPVIVLTADTTTAALERALAAGATDFLTKPFNATEIVLRIRNLLQTRELYSTLTTHLRAAELGLAGIALHEEQDRRHVEQTRSRVERVLAGGGPQMVFQPVVDLRDATVVGHEALSRFPPDDGDPASWFRAADAVGLGQDLELSAATRAVSVRSRHGDGGFLALNVSPGTLLSGRLGAIDVAGLDVVIELTEHEPVADYRAVAQAFAPLRERGARLAIDDTGAGYAGLRHLLHLGADIIKLDLSLVTGITEDPARRALTAALVTFARDVGATVVAEGVESPEQAEVLAGLGVGWAQGWLYGRPDAVLRPVPQPS